MSMTVRPFVEEFSKVPLFCGEISCLYISFSLGIICSGNKEVWRNGAGNQVYWRNVGEIGNMGA